ncbi:MAG: helix-turn-helix transcriptional regulator [Oscillospiraceae bacterium]|nr:helix-turn-helix transcriptional regulator [Oscillospiraceae bacterium]
MSVINTKKCYTTDEAQFLKNIGFRIQFFRKKLGLSQEELAERSGLSYSTISHIESTTSYPLSMLSLYRIAKALAVEPYQLLTFD